MRPTPFHKRKGAKLGQHFLTNPKVAHDLAEAIHVQKNDTVLEIGPGKGMLTSELLNRGARVIAVEKDPDMVAALNHLFARELREKKLILHPSDIRDFTKKLTAHVRSRYKIAANIPYYITGELLRTFLTHELQPKSIAFLVQKEVAERIARSKKESILSLSVKMYGDPRYVRTVSRGNFHPSPSVDSAILAVDNISKKRFSKILERDFFQAVKAGFAQKRKTIAGNLTKLYGATARNALEKTKIDPRTRAEDIHIPEWLLLLKHLSKNN